MRLHLLAGCRNLLLPLPLAPELAAGLIGPQVRVATAFWLAPDAGLAYHDFLRAAPGEAPGEAPGDRRLEVFALALKQNFGARFEPLVVLPGLLGAAAETRPELELADLELVQGLWTHAGAARLVLHAVALPATADPEGAWAVAAGLAAAEAGARLAALAAACAARGVPATALETRLTETAPGQPAFAALWRNAVAGRLAAQLRPGLAAAGLALDPGPAGAALGRLLAAWEPAGVAPAFGLTARDLEGIAGHALPALLGTGAGHG